MDCKLICVVPRTKEWAFRWESHTILNLIPNKVDVNFHSLIQKRQSHFYWTKQVSYIFYPTNSQQQFIAFAQLNGFHVPFHPCSSMADHLVTQSTTQPRSLLLSNFPPLKVAIKCFFRRNFNQILPKSTIPWRHIYTRFANSAMTAMMGCHRKTLGQVAELAAEQAEEGTSFGMILWRLFHFLFFIKNFSGRAWSLPLCRSSLQQTEQRIFVIQTKINRI